MSEIGNAQIVNMVCIEGKEVQVEVHILKRCPEMPRDAQRSLKDPSKIPQRSSKIPQRCATHKICKIPRDSQRFPKILKDPQRSSKIFP
jgi:hypothetical protein